MAETQKVSGLGEVAMWWCRGHKGQGRFEVSLSVIRSAMHTYLKDFDKILKQAGRELHPRNVMLRAVTTMKKGRDIAHLEETYWNPRKKKNQQSDPYLMFQFTGKVPTVIDGEKAFEYQMECRLMLNKRTGDITEVDPLPAWTSQMGITFQEWDEKRRVRADILKAVTDEFNRTKDLRGAADITRYIQLCFKWGNVPVIPLRETGGAYWVPDFHKDFLDAVDAFVTACGGSMRRLDLTNTQNSQQTIGEAVEDALEKLVIEQEQAFKAYTDATTPGVLKRASEKLVEVRQKIAAYHAYISGEAACAFEKTLDDNERRLRAMIAVKARDTAGRPTGTVTEDEEAGELVGVGA